MVTEKKKIRDKRKHPENGDKLTMRRKAKQLNLTKKARSVNDDEDDEPGMDEEEEIPMDEDEYEETEDEQEECDEEEGECRKKKHIHPCICDLTARQKERIEKYLDHKRIMQKKYNKRVKEIEEDLARMEEERLEREREQQEQEELFGDEYEVIGKKKKRKKRSARRASMVSLGVKQVINWKKQPKITVKHNTASTLRKKYTSYCGKTVYPLSPPVPVDYHKEPNIPIRSTVTSDSRSKVNINKKNYLIKHEDKRPLFQTPYYT